MTDARIDSSFLQRPDAALKALILQFGKRQLPLIAAGTVYQMGIHPCYFYIRKRKQRKQLLHAVCCRTTAVDSHAVKAGIQLQMHGSLQVHACTALGNMGKKRCGKGTKCDVVFRSQTYFLIRYIAKNKNRLFS